MSTPTRVQSLEVAPLDIPLHVPFGISGGTQAIANNVLVAIQLADGTRGYGEAAPLPPYNGETQAEAMRALGDAQPWISSVDAQKWQAAGKEFAERFGQRSGSARCALEMALLDALNRHTREPMWKFFGGAGTELETDMTVTTGSPAEAAEAARDIAGRGIRMIKVKIGGSAGPKHDLARLAEIHAVAPRAPLILDGNAGVSRADATELIRGLKSLHITPALLEQWLAKNDYIGMRALREESGWLVAADEMVTTADDARRVIETQAADVINIKLMKAGLAEAVEIARLAKQANLGLMIGGNVESMLAMSTSACFAAGVGGFQFADLDTPLFMATNPFEGGFDMQGGRISVAHIEAGHGVMPRCK